ncbi:MAG TPA: acyl-CoA dehydrogenase family protein [Dehalococcoidia bacterium]|nr:acyl-CoA dehydrogenase family protein [Dehalococcoidia bacterium]
MDLELTDAQQLIIANVRRFIRDEIRPLEADLDPDAYSLKPDDKDRLVAMVKEMGLYQMDVPEEYGGPGVDTVTRTLVAEELSQHRAGLYAPAYGTFGSGPPAQLYGGSDFLKEEYLWPSIRGEKSGFFGLSEPSGGSDPARAIQTRGVRDGDEWVINGRKLWNSGADTADYGVVYVRTDPSKGRQGITAFVIDTDTPGFRVERLVQVLRAHYTTELSFTDMRVPHQNILGEEGGGFALANDQLSRNRIPYSSACLGVAVYANELAVEWSKQRVTFGEPLANRQAIQWMLVDNEIDIRSGRWLALDAAARVERGDDFRFEASMAKLICTEGAGRVVDRCMQIYGGLGMSKDMPFERWYRELRIRRVGEGPSEVQRIVMARDILNVRSGS